MGDSIPLAAFLTVAVTESRIEIDDGNASAIGTGISWNWKAIERMRLRHVIVS